MRSGEYSQNVNDGYGKEMASSSDVKVTDEDKDEDESKIPLCTIFLTNLQWRI